MEKFKDLDPETGYQCAWNYVFDYLVLEFSLSDTLDLADLRAMLDRMHAFAQVDPIVTATSVQLDLRHEPADADSYRFSFLLLLGFLEAVHHFAIGPVHAADVLNALDNITPFIGLAAQPAADRLRLLKTDHLN